LNFGALRARSPAPLRLAGGWPVIDGASTRVPGAARPDGHGTMVALNAVSLAPETRVWDLPFLPDLPFALDQILDPVPFASHAAAALLWADTEIRLWLGAAFPGPWVFCHAWGIYDRRLEVPADDYTGNPINPLNLVVRALDAGVLGAANRRDQVFGAGNGGQFDPSPLCGPGDTGPQHSTFGANSLPSVLTVGAVRADGMWIGYSSQGPGQSVFGDGVHPVEKPDLCAPSHFVEATDGAWLSSGTSAACGFAAGAVAALRSAGSPLAALAPAALRAALRNAARKPPDMLAGLGYDYRYGHGILDLAAVLPGSEGEDERVSAAQPRVSTVAAAPPVMPGRPAPVTPVARGIWGRLSERLRSWLGRA
jgi:hypothetical protein